MIDGRVPGGAQTAPCPFAPASGALKLQEAKRAAPPGGIGEARARAADEHRGGEGGPNEARRGRFRSARRRAGVCAGERPGSRHGQGRRARVRHGQLGARGHQASRVGRQARLQPRGATVRQRTGHQRGTPGRGRGHGGRRLSLGVAPARRWRAAELPALFEHRRHADGAAGLRNRQPHRPQGQEARRRRRSDRQELAPDPGPRRQAPRHRARGRGRAGLRRAAAAQREGPGRRARRGAQLLALRRPPRGQGLQGAGRRRGSDRRARRRERAAAARLRLRGELGTRHPGLVEAFAAASREAKELLKGDQEWERIRPLTKAEDDRPSRR